MRRIFVSYRFTGEDPKDLEQILGGLKESLEAAGHNIFCSFWMSDFFKQEGYDREKMYDYCLQQQKEHDVVIGLVKTDDYSRGMAEEAKRATEYKQPYVLVIRKGLEFKDFRNQASDIIEFQEYKEAYDHLKEFDFDRFNKK